MSTEREDNLLQPTPRKTNLKRPISLISETRQYCFLEGWSAKPEACSPYKLRSYQHAAWTRGFHKREGREDWPNWKCVYKKGTYGYMYYKLGFEQAERVNKWL